jgi:hypothetical protein
LCKLTSQRWRYRYLEKVKLGNFNQGLLGISPGN